jgi:hypothetical protein
MGKKGDMKVIRLKYLRDMIEKTGSTRINASEVARLFNVSSTQIENDKREIYQAMNAKSKENVGIELSKLDIGLKRGLRELESIINSEKGAESKLKAIEIYSKLTSDYVSNLTKMGLFTPEKQKAAAPPIICWTYGSCKDDDFIDFCKKEGHAEVKEYYDAFQTFLADKEVKAAIERQERLHPRENHIEVDTAVLEEDEIDKPPEDVAPDALETAPGVYPVCPHCNTRHDPVKLCFDEIVKMKESH